MHIHILGICGTFMGGLAVLAKEAGHRVTGCDANVYPPMSTQLEAQGIELIQGYGPEQVALNPDLYVVGNVMTRGNPLIEEILNRGLPYVSGPQWIGEHILRNKWVLAVAGTHGKTTTTSMLAWILEDAGYAPGFLIGGVPMNFGISARLHGDKESDFFVIEADEYDTAFFDKRSKFVHYHAKTAVLNNLEYDHADIFPDIGAIETQFHHLVRTVPGVGRLVVNGDEASIGRVLKRGCWSDKESFGSADGVDWAMVEHPGGASFDVLFKGELQGTVHWDLSGKHNRSNALAAIAAARHVGVPVAQAIASLGRFQNVKRRMEVRGVVNNITVVDDFAHHPTAIATTLEGLRAKVGDARIVVAMEPRSNSMRLGAHAEALAPSLALADAVVFLHRPGLEWDAAAVMDAVRGQALAVADTDALLARLDALAKAGDHVVFMSNGGFDAAPRRFLAQLQGA